MPGEQNALVNVFSLTPNSELARVTNLLSSTSELIGAAHVRVHLLCSTRLWTRFNKIIQYVTSVRNEQWRL